MVNRVLLIVPPFTLPKGKFKVSVPPLGVAYIAAVLEKENYLVKIIDAPIEGFNQEARIDKRRIRYGLSYEQIKDAINEFKPAVVGVALHSISQYDNALATCQAVKEVNKETIIVLGGSGISPPSLAQQILEKNQVVDFIIIGEAEYAMRDLLAILNEFNQDFSKVNGLAYRAGNEIRVNPKTKFIENLDELPFPARHLLPIEKYFKINVNQNFSGEKRTLQIVASRGCPHRCTFCATTIYWGNRYRTRTAENILSEINHLVIKYKIKELQFTDDSLTSHYDNAKRVFELLKERPYHLKWCTPNGINVCTLDEKLLRLMKESGCYEVRLPIESGNQEILNKVIQKPVNLEYVKKVVAMAKKLGIITNGFFAIGFPGETLANIKQTFRFARELKIDDVTLSIFTPLPGTKLMEICQEKGYLSKDSGFKRFEFTSANIETEEFCQRDLERIYIRETLLLNLNFIFRNPKLFLKRYGCFLLHHPLMVFNYMFNYLSRIIKR